MTENRFTIIGDRSISDHHKKRLYDLSNFDGVISVYECLNELHEENQQCENEIARLQLINNKLKDKDYTNYEEKIQGLHEENKKLKEEIETLHEQIVHFMDVGDV